MILGPPPKFYETWDNLFVAPADAVHGRVVEDALQASVIALRAVKIPADTAGVAGNGCKPGQSGEPVRGFEASDVAAGDGEEFRTEQRSETGEAFDDGRVRMLAKSCRDEFVDLGDLGVEGQDPVRECLHDLGGELLAGQRDVLAGGGLDCAAGQQRGIAGLAGSQPALQPCGTDAADRGRGLNAGQQRQRALAVAVVEAPLQGGEDGSSCSRSRLTPRVRSATRSARRAVNIFNSTVISSPGPTALRSRRMRA